MKYLKLDENIKKSLKRLNIKIDYESFTRFFSNRLHNHLLKIPMAVEHLMADSPTCAELIAQYHTEQKAAEMIELEKNKKRLDELLEKITYKSNKTNLLAKERTERKIYKLELKIKKHDRQNLQDYDYRIYPLFYAPLVVCENDQAVLKPMRFQCLPQSKSQEYDKKSGLYKAKKESLTQQYFERVRKKSGNASVWEPLFGYRHGILILNGFYEFAKSGQSVGFGPKESDSMLVPCLYDSWTSADGQKQLDSFAVITKESADLIQEYGYLLDLQ